MAGDAAHVEPQLVEAPRELEREQQVRELALPVSFPRMVRLRAVEIVPLHIPELAGLARDRDDARARRREQPIEQQSGEREVDEVIHTELPLVAVFRELARD